MADAGQGFIPPDAQAIVQMGYVVPDLNRAIVHWSTTLGIGPFTVSGEIIIDDARYRGEPTDVDLVIAVAQAGTLQVELIQQNNDVPSCYRDLFPADRGGLHHVAVRTTDFLGQVARYQAMGCPTAFCGRHQGRHFAYMDTSASLGIMVELLEAAPTDSSVTPA